MSKRRENGNLRFAVFFFIFVAGIVFLSLVFRGIFLLKESKFDGSSHFTVEVLGNKNQIISFSPKNSTIGILTIKNIDPKSLNIPIEAIINSNTSINKKNISSSLFKMLFDFRPAPVAVSSQKQINFIDVFRLLLYTETVKDSSIIEEVIDNNTDSVGINSIESTFFADPQILDEKESIEVVNATDVYGLGNKFANVVSNMGGNVILVSTGDLKKESEIQYTSKTYTVDKLSSILGFKTVKLTKKSLPDVIIIVGQDSER